MLCACGIDLGRVTLKTCGLCPSCGRSKWLQVAVRFVPKSQTIASGLNKRRSILCVHHTAVCFTRCGVRNHNGHWEPISSEERQDWFSSVNDIRVNVDKKGPWF